MSFGRLQVTLIFFKNLTRIVELLFKMPQYKLYYFPIKGRAEIIRLLFAQAGVEFEDIQVPFSEWKETKSSEY